LGFGLSAQIGDDEVCQQIQQQLVAVAICQEHRASSPASGGQVLPQNLDLRARQLSSAGAVARSLVEQPIHESPDRALAGPQFPGYHADSVEFLCRCLHLERP
jgi:hypothetical protein